MPVPDERRRRGRGAGGGLFPAGYAAARRTPTADDSPPEEAPAEVLEAGNDAASRFLGAADSGYADSGYADSGYADSGYADSGYADSGYADAGYADAGYDEVGYPETADREVSYVGTHPAEEHPAEGHPAEEQRADAEEGHYLEDGTWVPGGHYLEDGTWVQDGYFLEDGTWVEGGYYLDDGTWVGDGPYAGAGEEIPPDEGYWDHADTARGGRLGGVGRRHPLLVGFLGLVLVVVLLAGAGIFWASRQIDPGGHLGPRVEVTIPSGSSSSEIGHVLARAGIIHSGSLFRYYVKIEGSGPLLAGTYLLARNESYDRVIDSLEAGPVIVTDKLVIPEGFTLRQVAAAVAALPGMHLSAAHFLALSSSGSVRSPLEPAGVNDLEGLVYAATYTISRTDTESTILEEMVQDFDEHMESMGLAAGAAKLHMTPYQVITVASIVQGEAKFASQYPDTASVLYNRLASGMTLGADSTLIYALRQTDPDLDISKVDYEQASPYNTRLNKGLPPTPIDNASLPALAAAINPPHTDLEYFVAVKQDGELGFASTNAGFEQLENECDANHTGC